MGGDSVIINDNRITPTIDLVTNNRFVISKTKNDVNKNNNNLEQQISDSNRKQYANRKDNKQQKVHTIDQFAIDN